MEGSSQKQTRVGRRHVWVLDQLDFLVLSETRPKRSFQAERFSFSSWVTRSSSQAVDFVEASEFSLGSGRAMRRGVAGARGGGPVALATSPRRSSSARRLNSSRSIVSIR